MLRLCTHSLRTHRRLQRRLAEARVLDDFSESANFPLDRDEVHRHPEANRGRPVCSPIPCCGPQVIDKIRELATSNGVDWDDDKKVIDFFADSADEILQLAQAMAYELALEQIEEVLAPLDDDQKAKVLEVVQKKDE